MTPSSVTYSINLSFRIALLLSPLIALSGLWHDVGLQRRVGGRDVRDVEAELFANDVAPLRDRRGFVEGDLAIAALTAEAAVAGDDQLLRRDVCERRANRVGDLRGPVGLQRTVTHGADADFLGQLAFVLPEHLD